MTAVPPPDPILIVDDDADALSTLADLLAQLGYPTLTASGGADALRLLASGVRPAVILVDFTMPRMDGATFCTLAREIAAVASVPRVFVSGAPQPPDLLARTGAKAFLPKPLDPQALIALFDSLQIPRGKP